MNRFVSLVLVLLMCFAALSEAAVKQPEFLPCVCGFEECVCFAREGDTGYLVQTARSLLFEMNLLDKLHPQAKFDENMKTALLDFQELKGLDRTGLLDDETLTMLFATEHEMLIPDVRCFYVPVNGGQELHISSVCSGMIDSRMVSARSGMYLCHEGVTRLCRVCCSSLINN